MANSRSSIERPVVPMQMDHYHLWFDLRTGAKDTDLVEAIHAMLGHMRENGLIEGYAIQRKKLGLGPATIGEWHVDIVTRDLAQLQEAFDEVTPRSGNMEKLHAAVWSRVEGLQTALYRDFPDANRQ